MAKKEGRKERKKRTIEESEYIPRLKEETIRAIVAVIFFVLGVFLILSAFNKGGVVGQNAFQILSYLFGVGYYVLVLLFFILCVSFFRSLEKRFALTHTIGGIIFFVSGLALVNITLPDKGGIIGGIISGPLLRMFDAWASVIILIALLVISLLVMFDAPLNPKALFNFLKKKQEDDIEEEDLIIANPEQLETKEEKVTEPEKPQPKKTVPDEFGIKPFSLSGKEFKPPP